MDEEQDGHKDSSDEEEWINARTRELHTMNMPPQNHCHITFKKEKEKREKEKEKA